MYTLGPPTSPAALEMVNCAGPAGAEREQPNPNATRTLTPDPEPAPEPRPKATPSRHQATPRCTARRTGATPPWPRC